MNHKTKIVLGVLSVWISFVFIQSLFYKYADSPETQYIFTTLDVWAGTFGLEGIFAKGGIFSQYVIGTAELIASGLLLAGFFTGRALLHVVGAAMAVAVISGAIVFHLFTPLGVAVPNADGSSDGGTLFIMACSVWLSGLAIVFLRREAVLGLIARFTRPASA